MADEDKKTYPMMPVKNWWALRKKFRSAIPKEITPNYVASALNMSTSSARNNILPYLRTTGMIDQDNKPTGLAVKWRDDKQYPQVCEAIRQEIYPQELLDLASPSDADRTVVQTWFANHTGGGASTARKQAAFYMLLCEADPTKESEVSSPAASPKNKQGAVRRSRRPEQKPPRDNAKVEEVDEHTDNASPPPVKGLPRYEQVPQIHFNIQVVLPENASSETYDNIFKSIATHLLGRTEA